MPPTVHIRPLSASELVTERDALVNLLRACVHGGASLGYLDPLPHSDATAFWGELVPQVASGERLILAARDDEEGQIVGSAQLVFATKPNGRHRAEVCKLMVLPSHRRQGIAVRLMDELEWHARQRGIRLLHLDTSEGPSGACRFYESIGYSYAGGIPDWALDPDGTPAKNAIYFKQLR